MKMIITVLVAFLSVITISNCALAQFEVRQDIGVSPDVRLIYRKAADYLANTQEGDGSWNGITGEQPAVAALSVMAFLSTGEDPNFGRYAKNVRSALRFIISKQNPQTGYIPENMYVHGFSMLAMAEAYGAVSDELLWSETDTEPENRRSLGESLELAVRLAVAAQKINPLKGWRYSPKDSSADTSVTGAVLMGLLAARNAGINVPDECIDNALNYMRSMTSIEAGTVGYSDLGFDNSPIRPSIACLVFSIGKRYEWPELKATKDFLTQHLDPEDVNHGFPEYQRYYQAQALFQADYEGWKTWNAGLVSHFRDVQTSEGQIGTCMHGPTYSTAMAMLALALNFRFLPIYER